MLAHDYATAVANEITDGKDFSSVLSSLDRVLKAKGHTKLRARILSELSHIFTERGSKESLTLGTEEDNKKLQSDIAAAKKELGIAGEVETVVDPSLVGGFILRTEEKEIDRSYKRALINLYRSIITNR